MHILPSITKIFSSELESTHNYPYMQDENLDGHIKGQWWSRSICALTHNPNDITILIEDDIILKSDLFSPIFDGLTKDEVHKMNYYFLLVLRQQKGVEHEDIKLYIKRFIAKYKQLPTSLIKPFLPLVFPLWKYALENEMLQYDDEWVNLVLTNTLAYGLDIAYTNAITIASNKLRDFRDEYRKHNTIVVRDIDHIDPEVRNELILNMLHDDLNNEETKDDKLGD